MPLSTKSFRDEPENQEEGYESEDPSTVTVVGAAQGTLTLGFEREDN